MLKIKKVKNEMGSYDFNIMNDEEELNIIFGGNGDLYFYVVKKGLEAKNKIVNFEITKENFTLYTMFENLYNQILNCEIFKLDKEELEFYTNEEIDEKNDRYQQLNDELKQGYVYNNLVNNGVISWRHDEQVYEKANILNIYKEDEKYRLEFILQSKDLSTFIDVRFRNSGSRYQPFNMAFMDFYKELQQYYPECHQIHIEEYLYQRRLELKHK